MYSLVPLAFLFLTNSLNCSMVFSFSLPNSFIWFSHIPLLFFMDFSDGLVLFLPRDRYQFICCFYIFVMIGSSFLTLSHLVLPAIFISFVHKLMNFCISFLEYSIRTTASAYRRSVPSTCYRFLSLIQNLLISFLLFVLLLLLPCMWI